MIEFKDLVIQLGLTVNKITPITILKEQINVFFVLLVVVKFDDIGRIHLFHALDLAIKVFTQMRLFLNHFDMNELQCH
jgi:hypothetical protein